MPLSAAGSPLNNSNVGAAAAAVSVSLTPTPNGLAYITGFSVTSTNPAAIQSGLVTVTGVSTPGNVPLNFQLVESTTFGGELLVLFPGDGLPAYGRGVVITVPLPGIASGGAAAISVYGYQI